MRAAATGAEVLVVEGQGALTHPGYSGVTLGLLHGAMPDAMILCHEAGRHKHSGDEYEWTTLPTLSAMVEMYEKAAAWVRPACVVGIALNTSDLDDDDARATHAVAVATSWVYERPEEVNDGWETVSLESVGMDAAPFVTMMNILRSHDDHRSHAVLIARHGRLVFEQYFQSIQLVTIVQARQVWIDIGYHALGVHGNHQVSQVLHRLGLSGQDDR